MPRATSSSPKDVKPTTTKVPRPPNAWILYRTDRLNIWKAARSPNDPPVKQADISRFISQCWKDEPQEVHLEYEKRAAIAKDQHKKKYPNYKYNPVSKEVKEKMRAEEREAKKKAREEAKAAAKAGTRKPSSGSRVALSPSPASPPNVKLEGFNKVKRKHVPEPIIRGCGPSPPIDYDPESSSTGSSTPLLSSSSSFSARSSPMPASATRLPSVTRRSPNYWQPSVSSPVSSPSTQPPPPSYSAGYIYSPAPSRQSSANWTPALPAPSIASTPSDSPPSYTDGDIWYPPVPELVSELPYQNTLGNMNAFTQYPPLLQPGVTFQAPVIDPFLLPEPEEQANLGGTNPAGIFELCANQPYANRPSAQSPPSELEFQRLLQEIAAVNEGRAIDPSDQLAPVLNMAELHETVEDHADEVGIPAPSDAQPWSLEDFASWVNAHPHDAMNMADPEAFYYQLSAQVLNVYQAFHAHEATSNPAYMAGFPPEDPLALEFPRADVAAATIATQFGLPVLPSASDAAAEQWTMTSSYQTSAETQEVAPPPVQSGDATLGEPATTSHAQRFTPSAALVGRRRVGGVQNPPMALFKRSE